MITRRELIGGIAALSSLFLLQGKSDNGHGKKKGHHKDMSNGLLNGLTEIWFPVVATDMNGLKTGLNALKDGPLDFVDQAGFPGGKALLCSGGDAVTLNTDPSLLLSSIGITDFAAITWMLATGTSFGMAMNVSGDNSNGFDIHSNLGGHPNEAFAELPAADSSYPSVFSTGGLFSNNTPHMIACWYLLADDTLRLSVDGGSPFAVVNMSGIGPADPTNFMSFFIGNGNGNQLGQSAIWQGTEGVANAVSQLGNLYTNKLQYSDFDSGGGNPHTAYYGTLLQQGA